MQIHNPASVSLAQVDLQGPTLPTSQNAPRLEIHKRPLPARPSEPLQYGQAGGSSSRSDLVIVHQDSGLSPIELPPLYNSLPSRS
ncbi:hypothetical protein VKT23_004855 [Stygiomarasmius scandens]|uniref:Uncharacterized protein n=1 Tax=Marasmiellus scandens TaxID=2682957 RepID=A0ABR1JSE8_9AGAR